MPVHEFACAEGHITEKLFLTFAAAEAATMILCPLCPKRRVAKKVEFSVPGQPILYGEGFYKPAASGNHGYKRNDPSKAVKELSRGLGVKGLQQTVDE